MTKTSSTSNHKWIIGLDSLRFVLALIVLLSHIPCPWAETFKASSNKIVQLIGNVIPNLFCGVGAVIAFFIISGFVIHYPNKNGIADTKKFLVRRWTRVGIPLIAISLIAMPLNSFESIPIWSLYCELFYYTIYPLLVKTKINWRTQAIAAFILATIFIVWFAWNDVLSFISQKDRGYSGGYWQLGNWLTWIVGLPCWLLGVLLAEQIDKTSNNFSFLKLIGLRLLIIIIGLVLDVAKFHFFLSFILSMNIFALILFYWIKKEIQYYRNKQASPLLEYMGKFSYSLYLCHGVVYHFLVSKFANNNTTYLVFVLLGIAIAYAFYLLVEKPSHKLAQQLGKMV